MKTSLARQPASAHLSTPAIGGASAHALGTPRAPARDHGDRFERGGSARAWLSGGSTSPLGRPSIAARTGAAPATTPPVLLHPTALHPGLADASLLSALRKTHAPTQQLGYAEARQHLFGFVHNDQGHVVCVYTHKDVETSTIPAADDGPRMNTEHTFPQSWLKGKKAAVTDLHHLFPTDTTANEKRSSYPFGVVVGTPTWQDPSSKARLGPDAQGNTVFEPPDDHKGNAARAMFYVAAIYDLHISPAQEKVLRKWSEADPVDDDERTANARIAKVQGNTNPFVDAPQLVARIADF